MEQGRSDLYGAMQHFGGARKLAEHMNVNVRMKRRRSFIEVATDLHHIMQTTFGTSVRLPTAAELRGIGRANLVGEIIKFGGFKYFAKKAGWVFRTEGKLEEYKPTKAVNPYLAYSLFEWERQFWTDYGGARRVIGEE